MTVSLKKVINRLSKLSTKEQNTFADLLSNELNWKKAFQESQHELGTLAEEALQEYKSGKTRPLKLS